jgi:MerR family redox-sensitive transcriptional activator SoxR
MKIGELASRAGLNASALRYYERCGLLAAPYRMGGQRVYSDDVIYRVLLIRFASDMGFTLAEIKLFLNGLRDNAPVGFRWRKLAHRKIKEVNATIRRSNQLKSLLEHLLECQCGSLQLCVERLRLSPTLPLIAHRPKERQLQTRA